MGNSETEYYSRKKAKKSTPCNMGNSKVSIILFKQSKYQLHVIWVIPSLKLVAQ